MTLTVNTDRRLVRAQAHSTRYLLAQVTAPATPHRGERLPINISIVLDRSGSMSGERKFVLARDAVEQALEMLRPEDRFSLVVYDTRVDVLMLSSLATAETKREALAALSEIAPRGGTDLSAGWLCGCEQVLEFPDPEHVSRCLLLTDGLANHGVRNRGELARHAGVLRERGVVTTTFGVGANFDERLLRDMAHDGGGNFYFIEDAEQIPEMLSGELGEALEVTLRDASLVVRPNGGESVEILNRFRSHRLAEHNGLVVELGDLVSGQKLDVVLGVRFPRGEVGDTAGVVVELRSTGALVADAACAVEWTYASHAENDAQTRDGEVDRAVASLYAARARAEATEANRHGRYERARTVLEATAARIASYAGRDPVLRNLVTALSADVHRFADAPMSAVALKSALYRAETSSKGRDSYGRARR